MNKSPDDPGESYEFFMDGIHYQDKYIELISSAKKTIILQTYIFEQDAFGQKVADSLIAKAMSGVQIIITIDYFGSFNFSRELQAQFQQTENIQFYFFNPLKFQKLLQIGRRLHHKVLIIDNEQAILGGININDSIEVQFPNQPRLDFAVLLKGDVVTLLTSYCSFILQPIINKHSTIKKPNSIKRKQPNVYLKINDWFKDRKQITSSYLTLIRNAQQDIILIHGYFFPSLKILKELKKKAGDGVSITLILPKHSDWQTWLWASNYLYYSLIKINITIMEWEGSNLHGKLALFDNKVVTLGSHNLNYTSSYGNLELNLEIHNKDFVQTIKKTIIQQIIPGCRIVTANEFLKLPVLKKVRNGVFSYLLLFISSISISLIKFSRRVNEMSFFSSMSMLLLFFIGILGIILPVLPGFPFLLAAFALYMKKGSSLKVD